MSKAMAAAAANRMLTTNARIDLEDSDLMFESMGDDCYMIDGAENPVLSLAYVDMHGRIWKERDHNGKRVMWCMSDPREAKT